MTRVALSWAESGDLDRPGADLSGLILIYRKFLEVLGSTYDLKDNSDKSHPQRYIERLRKFNKGLIDLSPRDVQLRSCNPNLGRHDNDSLDLTLVASWKSTRRNE